MVSCVGVTPEPRSSYQSGGLIGDQRIDATSPAPSMTKAKTERKGNKDEIGMYVSHQSRTLTCTQTFIRASSPRPRWSILPPEIILMILQYLTADKEALRACSRATRDFRHVALSLLGRHLTVNDVDRLKECARMIRRGAFQHVRSLDLGVDDEDLILEEYWKRYITILGSFSQYRTLNRLWLSEVPFTFLKKGQKKRLRETIIALGSTVTTLGLYECHFSSYQEMISLIRSFALCDSLYTRDCITREQATGRNAFAGLPEHRLIVKDLQLFASSSDDLLIDVSSLIEDAALDVGSLTCLLCNVRTCERTQRVAAAVTSSPVERFQVACTQPEGFQGEYTPWALDKDRSTDIKSEAFVGHFSKWPLTSLTIGPQSHETNAEFLVEAFKDLPSLPRVDNFLIIYHFTRSDTFETDCWEYFNRTLTRTDLFPALKSVYVQPRCSVFRLALLKWGYICDSLWDIETKGLGPRKLLSLERGQKVTFIFVMQIYTMGDTGISIYGMENLTEFGL